MNSDPIPGNNKAVAAGFSGSLTLILVWLWNTFLPAYPMPAEVAVAFSTVISTASVYVTPHGGQPSE